MVAALVDIDRLESWQAYKSAVYHADRSKIIERAWAWLTYRESEEIVTFAAVLFTMDYGSLAGEVCTMAGITNVFLHVGHLDANHSAAFAGAVAMTD